MKNVNGFNGAWNPICPSCGGYMHAGHTANCPVTLLREREHKRLVELLSQGQISQEGSEGSP